MATAPSSGAAGERLVRYAGTGIGVLLFAALMWWGPLAGGKAIRSEPPPSTTPAAPQLPPSEPKRLAVPGSKIDAKVVPVALTADRALDPPRDPSLLGWWNASARPGADEGGTVVAGHTVHTGGGALDAMPKLKRGSKIVLRTGEGKLIYAVDRVVTYSKTELAEQAERIFDQDGPARLVLVTCDDWNGESYLSNVVAYARVVAAEPKPAA